MRKAVSALSVLPLASSFLISPPSSVCRHQEASVTAKSFSTQLFSIKSDQEQQLQQVLHDIEKDFLSDVPLENKQLGPSDPTSSANNYKIDKPREEDIHENDTTLLDINEQFASPAEYENTRFVCDETVQLWQDLNRDGSMEASDMIQEIANVANRFVGKGGDALNYWLRHNARTGYFLTNAALGTIGSGLHERLVNNNNGDNNGDGEGKAKGFIETLAQPKVVSRLFMETALSYEQDYQRIADGKYKLPYDMYTSNRQNSPFFFAQQTYKFVNEAIGTLSRRNRGTDEDKRTWISGIKSDMYPDYYQNAFHYQTDGWMSQESANVYETSTESLFLGRQDAMQRTALVPLVQFCKELSQSNQVGTTRPLRVLEVACGTGRFLTFARDNLPLDTEFTAVDLSPFYLDKARDNDKNWRSIRKKSDKANSSESSTDTMTTLKPVRAVQAKAEDLPFENEEFDAVVCMYLYHEVPRDIRAQIASEMARVTRPGGRVIFTDSLQLGDRPAQDATMGNFEKMNEPHYRDYISDFLPVHFENVGMECLTKTICSGTKTLAFGKPE